MSFEGWVFSLLGFFIILREFLFICVRFQLHTTHIDQVTTQLGLVPRQCSITFRDSHALSKQPIYCIIKQFHALHKPKSNNLMLQNCT
jgi:hypothetical protein